MSETDSNLRELLDQLPVAFRAIASQPIIAAYLIESNGGILMKHELEGTTAFVDNSTKNLKNDIFFDARDGALFPDRQLPWQRCLTGEENAAVSQLWIRTGNWLPVEVLCIALRNDNDLSGVMVIFAVAVDKQTAADWARTQIKTRVPHNNTVLVVDDIPTNQQLIVKHLAKMGALTDTASNGLEAVNACKQKRYALVLMDIDMPVLDGYEATAEIRKFETPLGIHTPIVAMTSLDRAFDRYKCLKSGMDQFIAKGSSKDRLREVVAQYVFNNDTSNSQSTEADNVLSSRADSMRSRRIES